jgi:large subunit ribosomal protein L13
MKSYLARKEDFERKHVLFDAAGQPVGRLAVRIANALRGKDKPTYTPHVDAGSFVYVINAEKVVFTGKKDDNKIYDSYSGYRSGQKFKKASEVREKHPERLIQEAVWGMLPKGRLGRAQYRKLRVYVGASHPHAAQKPEVMAN